MRAYGTLGLLLQKNVAELCNGSTYDSDSYCLGSNPSSAAKKESRQAGSFCIQIIIITAFQEKLQALLKAVLNRFANSRSQ